MNDSVIDVAFIAAKVAAIKNEKARMIVGGASLVYNVAQIARFRSMIVELSQICNYIVSKAQIIGRYEVRSAECVNDVFLKMQLAFYIINIIDTSLLAQTVFCS